jgi:outer membrane biosynthesis protein TonB
MLLGGDLWLRAIPDGPTIVREAAVHPPRISVVIAKPAPRRTQHPAAPSSKPTATHAPAELAAVHVRAPKPRVAHPHVVAPKAVPHKAKPAVQPKPVVPTAKTPAPAPAPSPAPAPAPEPTPSPTPPTPPELPPVDTPQPPIAPTPEPPAQPEPPVEAPAPATPVTLSTGHCANYASQALDGTSVTVSFGVNEDNCPVTLTSYQSTPTGHTHELYAAGVFAIGTWSLTVGLSCGTDNQVDLFLGPPPLILGGPSASMDLGAWAIIPACPS